MVSPGLDPGQGGGSSNDRYSGSEVWNGVHLTGDYYDDSGQPKRVLLTFSDAVAEWPSGAGGRVGQERGVAAVHYTLYVKPSQLQIRYPTRAQTMQTLGGAYIDTFGYGLPTGQIQGTFGWGKGLNGKTGVERMIALKKLYETWQAETIRKGYRLSELIVASDRVHFEVFWGDLEITHSSNSPFLINYTLPFTVVRDRNGPPERPYSLPPVGVAGGGTPEINTGGGS